jgi:hypothetical protein
VLHDTLSFGWLGVSAQKVEAAEDGARNQDDHGKEERGIEEAEHQTTLLQSRLR